MSKRTYMDASAALRANVDEFVTLEKPEKPLCRIAELPTISLYRKANLQP